MDDKIQKEIFINPDMPGMYHEKGGCANDVTFVRADLVRQPASVGDDARRKAIEFMNREISALQAIGGERVFPEREAWLKNILAVLSASRIVQPPVVKDSLSTQVTAEDARAALEALEKATSQDGNHDLVVEWMERHSGKARALLQQASVIEVQLGE